MHQYHQGLELLAVASIVFPRQQSAALLRRAGIFRPRRRRKSYKEYKYVVDKGNDPHKTSAAGDKAIRPTSPRGRVSTSMHALRKPPGRFRNFKHQREREVFESTSDELARVTPVLDKQNDSIPLKRFQFST